MKYLKTVLVGGLVVFGPIAACNSDDNDATPVTPGTVSITDVVTGKYKSAVTITTGTNSIVLRSKGVPDHVSPYWGSDNNLSQLVKPFC